LPALLEPAIFNSPHVYNPCCNAEIIFIILLFLGAAFIYLSFSELESVVETLQQGNFWFILLAVLIQLAWFMVAGANYQSLYTLLGMRESVRKLALLYASANFVNTVAPSAGVGGMAVFIGAASRDGHSAGKVTVASMLCLFPRLCRVPVCAHCGLIVLFRRNDLDPTEIGASAVLSPLPSLGSLLYLGSHSGKALGSALAWMARLVNRLLQPFIHREYLSEERAHEFANEMARDLAALPERPRSLILPFLFADRQDPVDVCA
jgi:glycosyltransferase 2 family protein